MPVDEAGVAHRPHIAGCGDRDGTKLADVRAADRSPRGPIPVREQRLALEFAVRPHHPRRPHVIRAAGSDPEQLSATTRPSDRETSVVRAEARTWPTAVTAALRATERPPESWRASSASPLANTTTATAAAPTRSLVRPRAARGRAPAFASARGGDRRCPPAAPAHRAAREPPPALTHPRHPLQRPNRTRPRHRCTRAVARDTPSRVATSATGRSHW